MTQINSVVDCILTINIDNVDINILLEEELTKFDFTISSTVEKCGLFEVVLLVGVDTKFTEIFEHVDGFLFI